VPAPTPPQRRNRGATAATTVLDALGYRLGAETRRLRAYQGPKSGRLAYLDRAGARIRIVVPDASRALAEAIAAGDPLLGGVAGDTPLGTPGWRLTFPDPASFEAFLTAYDSRE
jgi:hypothetical protein